MAGVRTCALPIFAFCLFLFPVLCIASEPVRVVVFAGEFERRDSIVMVRLPGLAGRVVGFRGSGVRLPLQVDAAGQGVFIFPRVG